MTTTTETITAFLTRMLDEDGAAARAAEAQIDAGDYVAMGGMGREAHEHYRRHDPARILVDVAARRAIVALHTELTWHSNAQLVDREGYVPAIMWSNAAPSGYCRSCADNEDADHDGPPLVPYPCPTLCHLAAVYSDAPGYDERWRP